MSDINDDDIQAEIKSRLKEMGIEEGAPASAPADNQPKSKVKPPAHLPEDQPLSNAQLMHQHEQSTAGAGGGDKDKTKEEEKGFDFAESQRKVLGAIKNIKPEQMAGAGAGYVLPKLTEYAFPGITKSPDNETLYRQRMERLQQIQENHPFKEYETKSKNLMAQQQFAQQAFVESQRQLNDAIAHNEMLKVSSVNDFLPPEFRTTPSAPESVLTRQPIGGEATSKYAEKFGLTPLESLKAPSMSAVQQTIPSVAESISRAQAVGPEFGKFGESQLLLGPEGQKTAMEQKREQTIREQQRLQAEAEAKHALAQQKAQAQIALENAQRAHDMNMKALRDVNKSIETHVQPGIPPTVTPEEQRLQKETERYGGSSAVGRTLGFVGRKILPRFSPIVAGTMAPEQALAAKEAKERGDIPRMLAHGLGALGSVGMATGIPIYSGLGMVANLPSIYYGAEDMMNPPPAPPPKKP